MLKNRLIPVILLKNGIVVQSYNFRRFLPIGNVKTAIDFFVNWDVDEIVILDTDATRENRPPQLRVIEEAARHCFVPLMIGGGIRNLETIRHVLNAGADKVSINSYAYEAPSFISRAAERFGSQCLTISIDVVESDGDYKVVVRNAGVVTNKRPQDWAREVEAVGAGEIFLNSVDRDGSRRGYDIALLQTVARSVHLPVIACGGVGQISHLADGILRGGCQAVAAANIFQHTEHSTIAAKAHLRRAGVPVRLNSDVKYEHFQFDRLGRPL